MLVEIINSNGEENPTIYDVQGFFNSSQSKYACTTFRSRARMPFLLLQSLNNT